MAMMGWRQVVLGLLGFSCAFQCLVSGTEDFLDGVSNLQCQSGDMSFTLPAMHNEFASTFAVLDYEGKMQDLRNDSTCGFWVGQNLDGSMTISAPYDGCYVREEHGDYVMTLIAENIRNGQVEYRKRDIKCPSLPALDAPSPRDCAAIQRSDRLQCANSSVPQDICEQMGCCFYSGDVPQCYYGKKLTAQCTDKGQVLITLAKELTKPSLILDSVFILGVDSSSCSEMSTSRNSAFLTFQFPLSCSAKSWVSNDRHVYENTIEATRDVTTWQESSISRDSTIRVTVRCSYSQTDHQPLQVEVLTLPPPLPVSTTGPLLLEMRIAKDEQYGLYYMDNEYPVTKILRDPVYLEVRILRRIDASLVLMLSDCWATSSPDATHQVKWPILVDGCPFAGDNYMTKQLPVRSPSQLVPYPTHYQRFVVNTFTFVDPDDQHSLGGLVYFHCSAAVCVPSATELCRTSCSQRKKRDLEEGREKITISKGPVYFIDVEMPSHMGVDLSDDPQVNIWDYMQNETVDPDFIGIRKEDPMDGDLIDLDKPLPGRVKDFDPDSSPTLWLRAAAVVGGVLAVTVAVLGVSLCHRHQTSTMYPVGV